MSIVYPDASPEYPLYLSGTQLILGLPSINHYVL